MREEGVLNVYLLICDSFSAMLGTCHLSNVSVALDSYDASCMPGNADSNLFFRSFYDFNICLPQWLHFYIYLFIYLQMHNIRI